VPIPNTAAIAGEGAPNILGCTVIVFCDGLVIGLVGVVVLNGFAGLFGLTACPGLVIAGALVTKKFLVAGSKYPAGSVLNGNAGAEVNIFDGVGATPGGTHDNVPFAINATD
jgi:hypothetical protein